MPFVTDTHALVWYLTGDPKLSKRAKRVFERTDAANEQSFVPCIALFELAYLIEKKRIVLDLESVVAALSSAENYRIEPMCIPVIQKSMEIPREKVADPWDRLIAATAIHLNVPLITRDKSLRGAGLEVLW